MRLEIKVINKLVPTLSPRNDKQRMAMDEHRAGYGGRVALCYYSLLTVKVCSLHPPSAASVHLSHAPHAHATRVNTKP